jgi:hypothetical protein
MKNRLDNRPFVLPSLSSLPSVKSTPNPADAGCNSKLAQYSPPATLRVAMRAGNTPSLRVAGFEDEDSLSDVAFCSRCLAVLSASEVGRTKRLTRAAAAYGSRIPPTPGIDVV